MRVGANGDMRGEEVIHYQNPSSNIDDQITAKGHFGQRRGHQADRESILSHYKRSDRGENAGKDEHSGGLGKWSGGCRA